MGPQAGSPAWSIPPTVTTLETPSPAASGSAESNVWTNGTSIANLRAVQEANERRRQEAATRANTERAAEEAEMQRAILQLGPVGETAGTADGNLASMPVDILMASDPGHCLT